MEFSHHDVTTFMSVACGLADQPKRFSRILQHWTDQGVLETTTTQRGRGNHRRYGKSQVVLAIILAALTNSFRGVSSEALKQLALSIKTHNEQAFDPIDLALTGKVPVPLELIPIGELFVVAFPPTEDVQLESPVSIHLRLDLLLAPLRMVVEARESNNA